jgi:hypothetical protein
MLLFVDVVYLIVLFWYRVVLAQCNAVLCRGDVWTVVLFDGSFVEVGVRIVVVW